MQMVIWPGIYILFFFTVNIPDDVGNLKKLESLQLSKNRLSTIPVTLNKLSALNKVVLSHNLLTKFPIQLCNLKHIDLLDLSHNKITEVPDEVRSVHAVELNLNQNQVCNVFFQVLGSRSVTMILKYSF